MLSDTVGRRGPLPVARDVPEYSRTDNRKLIDLDIDLAAAILDGHRLLPRQPDGPSSTVL